MLFLICALSCVTPSPEGNGRPIDLERVLREAKARVFPALVFVSPVVEQYEEGEKKKQEVVGSGVIVSSDGEVVTNHHVVDKAVEIRCLLTDGRVFKAELVGSDKDSDLALLRLEAPGPLFAAELGDSDSVVEGQFVMAMGAPWGMSRSVSLGIVSCTRRFLPGLSEYHLWFQTDASLNPGNSGGPLVDADGRVVGINAMATMIGGDMGFAIPSNAVKKVVRAIREHGEVRRGWTGLQLQPLKDFKRNMFFEGQTGVIVAGVAPGSPAERAGIRSGDVILSVSGREVRGLTEEDLPEIRSLLAGLPLDKQAELRLRRGGREISAAVTPAPKGKSEGEDFDCEKWNMTVKTINRFEVPGLHYFRKQGVYVQGVKYPGNASESGLRRRDMIVKVEGREIRTLEDMKKAYERVVSDEERPKRVRLEIMRRGLVLQVMLDYSVEYEED